MTLQPRYVLRSLAALLAVALLFSMNPGERLSAAGRKAQIAREAGRGAGPRELSVNAVREPVGRDRVVVPPIPGPGVAADGAVYVPRARGEIPFFLEPGPGADGPAAELAGCRHRA